MMTIPGRMQYLQLSDGLKRLPGATFETHHHPAVILDRASGPTVRVWGWWTPEAADRPALPCLLWAGELGWSATVVEPDILDSAGYERAFWSHRVKLLDLALANALGPYPSVEELELYVAAEEAFGPGARAPEVMGSLLWGILQLEAARSRPGGGPAVDPVEITDASGLRGTVDEELVTHVLSPTFAKPGVDRPVLREVGLAALARVVEQTPLRGRRRHMRVLPSRKPGPPGARTGGPPRGLEPDQTA